MPKTKNRAIACPTITTLGMCEKFAFQDLRFKPFIFFDYQKNNHLKYACVASVKKMSGIYVIKETASNKILHFGSSKKDLYEQIALVVQHYKIVSGATMIAIVKVQPSLIELLVKRIKLTHRNELIDQTFNKIIQLIAKEKEVPIKAIKFFDLYESAPVTPRPIYRIKSNINHLIERMGVYVIQIKEKKSNDWSIHYVGQASDLHKRLHAHFIRSQADYRPTSNYYHLRKTHDFKIGVIEFPKEEKGALSIIENYLIAQWDPPGNRYGRGLSKQEIASLPSSGWKAVEGVEMF